MSPVEPAIPEGQRRVEYAKDQPEYLPLPAALDSQSVVTTEWQPTAEELYALCVGGRVRIRMMTFGQPLQPIIVDTIGGEDAVPINAQD